MGDSLEVGDPPPEDQPLSLVDLTDLIDYLKDNVRVNIVGAKSETKSINAAFSDSSNLECIKRFLSDPQTPTLMIQRLSGKGMS